MPQILQVRLKALTDNSDQLNPVYQVIHPETDTTMILDFEQNVIRAINHVIGDAINIEDDTDGTKITRIPKLHVDALTMDSIISDREHPVNAIVEFSIGDQDGNNIKETYATKEELDAHNFAVSHITDFVENVVGLIEQHVEATGLNQFLPLIGGKIIGDLTVDGKITARNLDSPYATKETYGLVRIGNNINTSNGIIYVPTADDNTRGAMKLYHGRGNNHDGAVSQAVVEMSLQDLADISDNLYLKKTETANKAINDSEGNSIKNTYMKKDIFSTYQANKLNVTASNETPKEYFFELNGNSYNYPPIDVLKLNDEGEDETITVFTFDNADASSFIVEKDLTEEDPYHTITFDGTMHPITNYDIHMSQLVPCKNGFISESDIIPLNRFRKKHSINITTTKADLEENEQKPQSIKLFVSNGRLYATTGAVITDNWNTLTAAEKETAFLNFTNYADTYSNELIFELENVQVVCYTTDPHAIISGTFNGVPNKQIVIPKGLIPANSFVSILNVDIKNEIAGKGVAKVVASEDLDTWYTYKFNLNEWVEIETEVDTSTGRFIPTIEAVNNLGIDVRRIDQISNWSIFEDNIAFAYLVTVDEINDICKVDQLDITATMKGSWEHYNNFWYAYTNKNLIVKVFDSGDYKINYHKY